MTKGEIKILMILKMEEIKMMNQTFFKDWQGKVVEIKIDSPIMQFKDKEELKSFIFYSLENYINSKLIIVGEELKFLFRELAVYINYFFLDNKEIRERLMFELRTISRKLRQKTVVDGPFDRSI